MSDVPGDLWGGTDAFPSEILTVDTLVATLRAAAARLPQSAQPHGVTDDGSTASGVRDV